MAQIKYLDSRRIMGASGDTVEAPTFEDNFNYASQSAGDTVWVRNDTVNNYMRYNDTNKNLDFDQRQDTTNDSISYNLGSALDNTKWVCRMKVVFTTLTAGSNCDLHIGLSSVDSSSSVATVQDYIGIKLKYESAQKEIGTLECQDEVMNKGSDDVTTAGYFVTGTYYFELTRLSSTTYQLTTTKNSPNWDNPDDTLTGTISGSITGLQYIVVRNRLDSGSGRIQGTIDDIVIYDGVTSVTGKPKPALSLSGCKAYYNFEQTGTQIANTSGSTNFNVYSANQYAGGVAVFNTSSTLYNQTMNTMTFYMKKSGSPTGTGECRVYNGGTLQATSSNTIDVSTLTTDYTPQRFTFSTPYTIQSGDDIIFYYTGGDGSNYTSMHGSNTNVYDSTNTGWVRNVNGSWERINTYDMKFTLNEVYLENQATTANGFTDGLGSSADGTNNGAITGGTESNTNVNDVAHIEQQVGANYVIGEQITSGNVLIGKTITSLSMWLYQLGTQTGSETFVLGVWDSTGSLQHSFGTITRSDIPVGTTYSNAQKFTRSTGSYVLQQNDIVGIKSVSNPNNAWTVEVTQRDSNVYSNGQRALFTEGSSPTTSSTRDVGFEVTYDVTGKVGSYAWSFDGSNDYVDLGTPILGASGSTKASFSYWSNLSSTGFVYTDGNYDSTSTWATTIEQLTNGNTRLFIASSGADGGGNHVDSNVSVSAGWNHWVLTYDGSGSTNTDKIKIYLNGSQVSTTSTGTIPSSIKTVTPNARIGALYTGAGNYFGGLIDEFAIFDRVLTSTEISALYNSGTGVAVNDSSLQVKPETNSIFIETDSASRWWYDGTNWNMQPTFETDFSSNPTVSTADSNENYWDTTNNRWRTKWTWDNTSNAGSIDLYSKIGNQNLSDDNWTIRFKYTIVSQNFTTGSDSKQYFIGVTSHDYNTKFWYPYGSNVSTNFGLFFDKTGIYKFYTNNNSVYSSGTFTNFSKTISNETVYIEFIRQNGTTAKMNVYSDSSYQNLVESQTQTIASGLTGLRYLSVKGMEYSSVGVIDSNIDDLKIYNGVSSVQE